MTCIVGYIDSEKVFMGGDSAGVAGLDVCERKDAKVFKVQKFLIGYASSFRMGQLLRFKLNVPAQLKKEGDYQYMCTKFIDSVRKCLKDGGYLYELEGERGGSFLVGYKGRLYQIEGDFQVGENADLYNSVGCGYKYALGALNVIPNKLSPKKKIEKALETAVKFSAGVRPPFIIESI